MKRTLHSIDYSRTAQGPYERRAMLASAAKNAELAMHNHFYEMVANGAARVFLGVSFVWLIGCFLLSL